MWIDSTYPSPKPTLTLASYLGQNVGFGEGQVGSFPETYNDPEAGVGDETNRSLLEYSDVFNV